MRSWKTAACAAAMTLTLLSGCTAGPNPSPSPTVAASENAEPEPPVVPVETGPESTPSPAPQQGAIAQPDEKIVASLECEDVSKATHRSYEKRWGRPGLSEATQVFVGEGIDPGSRWWVVVDFSDAPTPDSPTKGAAYLTNAEDVDGEAQWLVAASAESEDHRGYGKYFPNVKWDLEGHKRLVSAVAKGYQCLGKEYPEPVVAS